MRSCQDRLFFFLFAICLAVGLLVAVSSLLAGCDLFTGPDDGARRIEQLPRALTTSEQEIIATYEPEKAIATLPALLPERKERERLLVLLERLESDTRVRHEGLTPEQRFENHKNGIKAASVVKKYGERLVPKLYEHLNPMTYGAAKVMEVELAEELRKRGFVVFGGH